MGRWLLFARERGSARAAIARAKRMCGGWASGRAPSNQRMALASVRATKKRTFCATSD